MTDHDTDPDDQEFMLDVALIGFHRARNRFLATADNPDASIAGAFIDMAEALWWAISVDEGYEKQHGSEYGDERAQNTMGRVMPGVRYARNRCGHQRALVLERSHLSPPFTLPVTLGRLLRWRRANELPPADGPHFERGRDDYERWLANRAASETLDYIAGWFARVQNTYGKGGRN